MLCFEIDQARVVESLAIRSVAIEGLVPEVLFGGVVPGRPARGRIQLFLHGGGT